MTPTLFNASGVPEVTGIAAFGTLVQVLSSPPGVTPLAFTTVFGVGDISGPSRSMDKIDTTSHSTGVPIKTFIPGLIDPGDISFPCYWKPDDPTMNPAFPFSMEALFYARKVTLWRVVSPDPLKTTVQFAGAVIELSDEYPKEGVVTRNTTIGISGAMEAVGADVELAPEEILDAPAAGGPDSIAVTALDDMPWIAVTATPWITITAPLGPTEGSADIEFTIAAQLPAAPARTGSILVAGRTITITQLAGV